MGINKKGNNQKRKIMKQKVETAMLNEETGMQQKGATSGLTFRETVIADRSALMTLKCSLEIRDAVDSMNSVRNGQSWRKKT